MDGNKCADLEIGHSVRWAKLVLCTECTPAQMSSEVNSGFNDDVNTKIELSVLQNRKIKRKCKILNVFYI